jgi:hypothetical protein
VGKIDANFDAEGDATCSANWLGQSGNGLCIGKENGFGHCMCSRGWACPNCDMSLTQLQFGHKCGDWTVGGEPCLADTDCNFGHFRNNTASGGTCVKNAAGYGVCQCSFQVPGVLDSASVCGDCSLLAFQVLAVSDGGEGKKCAR